MNWNKITSSEDIVRLKSESDNQAVLIFKHSTRCSISSTALSRLERSWSTNNITPYFLDLINHRDLSNQIASEFNVMHESPQILLIQKGKCIYNNSHLGIRFEDIVSHV